MKQTARIGALALMFSLCVVQVGCDSGPSEDDRALVTAALAGYLAAVQAHSGSDAAAFVSDATFEAYEGYGLAAQNATRVELEERPAFERLVVLSLRAHFDRAALEVMDGRRLFEAAIDAGLSGQDLDDIELTDLVFEGEGVIVSNVRIDGEEAPEGLTLRFIYQDNRWVWDVSSLFALVESSFAELEAQLGAGINDQLITGIEASLGHPVDESIWDPLPPSGQVSPEAPVSPEPSTEQPTSEPSLAP